MRQLFTLLLIGLPLGAAEPEARWPRSADDVQLTLKVVEALEEGPLVFEFYLKNVSKDHLKVNSSGLTCDTVRDWPERGVVWERYTRIRFHYLPPAYDVLAPNEQIRFVRTFQRSYLRIPAGKVEFRYRWDFGNHDRTLFTLPQRQNITIQPATAANIAATIARYRQLPKDDPERVSYIRHSRHPEFASLFAEIIADASRNRGAFREGNHYTPASRLVGEIYDCFPTVEDGFQFLKAHLNSATPFPNAIFSAWQQHHINYEWSLQTFGTVKEDRERVFYDRLRKQYPAKHGLMHWQRSWPSDDFVTHATTARHLDRRLAAFQFTELRTVPNLAVRIELYLRYPEHCPPEWVRTLLADIAKLGQPPTTFAALVAKLDHPRFAEREAASATLLEYAPAFAAAFATLNVDTLSEEARQRVTKVRAAMKTHQAPSYWEPTLQELFARRYEPNLLLRQAFAEVKQPSYVKSAFTEVQKKYLENSSPGR